MSLGLAIAALAVYFIGQHSESAWIDPDSAPATYRFACLMSVVAGLAMFAVAHFRLLSPLDRLLDAALLFEVGVGLLISIAENAIAPLPGETMRGQTSLAVWIAFFVLAVPASRGKSTLAAVMTACMGPVGLGVQVFFGNVPTPPLFHWFLPFATSFFMAAAASALARTMYDLGAQARQARELGSYQLVERLGQGGMGEVWRARHRMLAREAAIKLIRADALQTMSVAQANDAKRRFEREALATAQLQSPHTVTLYDYGVAEDGRFYYVMELLSGITLEELVQRFGPQPAARAAYVLLQVCDSLAEAHRLGLVHRDITHRNVLLCRLGNSYDFAKVLDFGLVKQTSGNHTGPTESHVAVGTAAFLSPEAALARPMDARADIYSLGCLAYWLLSGKLVFEEANTTAMILAQVQRQPVPPSQVTEQEIPAALEAIVLDCLAKEPAARPPSVDVIMERLSACPLSERWDAYRAERWWRAHQPENRAR